MEDIRNHGIAIERNFEKRHHEMTQENLQKKYLPKTITQEVEETRKKQHRNPQITEILTESDKTRKAVEDKLGGEFDYGDFEFGLDDILSGKDSILKDFRKAKLDAPPSAPETSIRYNFKTRPVRPKPKPMPQI